jgi:hypothetical protein
MGDGRREERIDKAHILIQDIPLRLERQVIFFIAKQESRGLWREGQAEIRHK